MARLDERLPPGHLDAIESDPVRMQWMIGSPPPPDKLILFADGSFARFPRTRWSYSNMRQLLPTSVVRRADRPVRTLPRDERSDLDAISFVPLGGGDTMTWAESLLANYTDGILILHRGVIVYERYFGVLDAHTPHIAYSVTKSFVATVAATLVHEGLIDEQAAVPHYLPELASCGYADATIRQLLDMTTGLQYVEDYADQHSSVWQFSRAGGFRPRPSGYQGPESFYDFIRTITKDAPHGERFAYKTVNTDTLGWVLRRMTGRSVSELLRERLWSTLGVEEDAYFTVDQTGVEFAGGGLNLTLRDMARFGEMMRLGGRFNDQQIVPAAVVDDIRRGGNRAHFALAGYTLLPGWSYRSMWWVAHNEHGAFTARGIHGQAIYVDPAAEMVIARFASHPKGANVNLDPTSLPAYHAMATHLMHG
jgi:CubicO group peptidase (beta-lactamase class C family)